MKEAIPLGVGAAVGLFVAPRVLNAMNVPVENGVGMDDLITVGLIVGSILLAYKFL